MSASFAGITDVIDSPSCRADHDEFSLSASLLSAQTRREMGLSLMVGDHEGIHAELRREKGRLKLLMELAAEAVAHHDLRDLIQAVMMSLRSAIDCDEVCIFLQSPNRGELEVYTLGFPAQAGSLSEGTAVPLADTIASHVFQTGMPWAGTCEHAGTVFPSQILCAERFSTGCMLPLSGRNRVVGTLGLMRAEPNPFSRDELDFLTRVSGQIALAVENALAHREISELKDKIAQEKLYPEEEIQSELKFDQIIGASPALRRVLQLVETVAPSDSTVLLLGETGTGKELIARAIHDHSRRQDRPFVKLNCAAIPTGLIESELFGHEKGAFTGAISQKVGRLELADHGTLFLDEIGDVPLEIQPKLLRALQEREFERLGSTRTKRVNVRLVAATNRDLKEMIAKREFRSDLYYRLNVFPIRIPPLRERREDITLLVRFFVQKFARQMQKQIETIPLAAMKKLMERDWPGNIRELQNFIERSVILTRGSVLEVPLTELRQARLNESTPVAESHSQEEIARIVKETINVLNRKKSVDDQYDKKQREEIVQALMQSNGRVGGADGAAARLGLNRTTLLSRMKKLGIDPKEFAQLSDRFNRATAATRPSDLIQADSNYSEATFGY